MITDPSRFDGRALFGVFAVVALAFLAANAFTQLAMRRIDGEERLQVVLDRAGESRRGALARMTLRDLLPAETA